MAIRISGTTGIDMGNTSVSNVDSGAIGTNAATIDYVKNNSDIGAITSYSQISGTNTIEGTELTNNIHDIFNDGSAVATYQLNGNANDLGGTRNGTASNVTYGEGKFGQAAFFNGTNSYINTAALPDYRTGFFFSAWVLTTTTAGTQYIVTQKSTGGWTNFSVLLAAGKISLATGNGASAYYIQYSAPTAVTDGWHNFVVTGTSTSIKIYVDGVLLTTQTGTAFTNSSNMVHVIGTNFYNNNYNYTGVKASTIDQVRFGNKVLTEEEVSLLYTETRVSQDATLNINQGTFIYPKGVSPRGYAKSSDTFTGSVPTSGVSNGWKYVAKDENNNFSFYDTKPTLGKTSAELYLKDGKLYKSSDDTEITPISFLSNKVRFASSVPLELAPSGIAKSVTDSIEANKLIMNGMEAYACRAWVNFNGTGTVAIRASGNVSSITDNGVGDFTVNFVTAMPDANFSVHSQSLANTQQAAPIAQSGLTTTGVRISVFSSTMSRTDYEIITLSIFR